MHFITLNTIFTVKVFFFLLFSLLIGQLWAQSNTRLEGWTGATVGIKWNKHWDTKISTQWRGRYDIDDQELRHRGLVELEGTYAPSFSPFFEDFRIGLGVRVLSVDATTTNHLLRLQADLMKDVHYKRWEFGYRLRFQMRDDYRTQEVISQKYWTKDLRNLLQVGYNFKKWKLDPSIWGELFLRDEQGEPLGFNHYRIGIKTRYKFNKQHSLSLRYFLERELQADNPRTTHGFVVQYRYQIKWKKPNKK